MRQFGASTFALIMTLFAWTVAAQQSKGSIRGTVSDPSGAVMQVAVTVRQTDTGLMRTTTTDGAGSYLLVELGICELGLRRRQEYSCDRRQNIPVPGRWL